MEDDGPRSPVKWALGGKAVTWADAKQGGHPAMITPDNETFAGAVHTP
jgi:hypothetical protein